MKRIAPIAFALLLLGGGAFLLPQTVAGDKKGEPKQKEAERKASPGATMIQDIAAAYQMADFGRKNKMPSALIAAAEVIGTSPSEEGKLEGKSQVFKLLPYDKDSHKTEAMELLKEARKLIADKKATNPKDAKAFESLIDLAEARIGGTRSPIGGSRVWNGYFAGDGVDRRDTVFVRLRGGEYTSVSLNGSGVPGLDLDLELIDDETNQVVQRDGSVGPNAFVRHFVQRTGDYRIVVINFRPYDRCDRYTLRAY